MIKDADKTIFVAAYTLDHPDYLFEFNSALKRGVSIKIVQDSEMAKKTHFGMCLIKMIRNQHQKFMIVDGIKMCSGSSNFTWNSVNNMLENCRFSTDRDEIDKYTIQFFNMQGQ